MNKEAGETRMETAELELNGKPWVYTRGNTLSDMLRELGLQDKRVALLYNAVVIPRSQHPHIALQPGDRIEIVTAVGGG